MSHIKYRPDIDGLRAIAILSVIAYHAFPEKIPGGFVGVDIFFVISGFLISTIIFNDLERNQFSYRTFYSRRIKRLFPALLLVLTTSWLIGWTVLFPHEFRKLGIHIVSGLGFISNLILWREAGYFDASSATKPLLHLWSLGIEEQFYIFWPVVLGLLWKNKFNLLFITVLTAIISFSSNIYSLFAFSSTTVFYLPINRFWELMIGGVLAYIVLHKGNWISKNNFYLNLQSIFGLTLISMSIGFLYETNAFPGWWALEPTIGAFFILSAPGAWINRTILSHQILVFIGLISYPLYLWHWVLLSYSHILEYTNLESKAVVIALSFILAWLTYEMIENKIRGKNGFKPIYNLIILSLILLCAGFGTSREIFPPRNNTRGLALAAEAIGDWEYPDGLKAINIDNANVNIKKGTREKVLFFGDSHMEQYAPRIVKLINSDPLNTKTAIFATRGGCPPIPNVYDKKHASCSSYFKETIINYALSPDIDSVVIGASWGILIKREKPIKGLSRFYYLLGSEKRYFDEDGINYALQSLEDLLSSLSKKKKVFLVIDNPAGIAFDPKTFFSGTRLKGVVDKTLRFQEYNKKDSELRNLMIEMAKRSNATVIDPVNHFCQENKCRTVMDNGTPIYKDSNHIRPFYVKEFIDFLDITVKK